MEHARQELAAKKKAKKSNPPGIFVVQADLLGNNERGLAAYLGLPDTRTLRELVDPPENDRLLRTHLQARENGFGVKGKNAATSYPTSDIFDCLRMSEDGFPSVPAVVTNTVAKINEMNNMQRSAFDSYIIQYLPSLNPVHHGRLTI